MARPALGLALLCAYFLASWQVRPLFFSNQNTYFVQGVRLGGVPGLQADWLSNTRSPHVAFTLAVAAVQALGGLAAGVHTVEVVLYLALVWALWIVGSGDHRRQGPLHPATHFLMCGVFLVLMMEPGPWNRLFHWGGLADQYLFGGYLQPSEFGIAILVALALIGRQRRRLAMVFLVIAASLHASYLLPCGAIAVLVAGEQAYRARWREAVALLAVFAGGVAPAVAYDLTFRSDPASTALAASLLTHSIIPQHAWPAQWLSRDALITVAIMVFGCGLAWRCFERSIALAMSGSLALVVLGTAYVYASGNVFVALLFPWRASVYLYPLSVLALVVSLAPVVEWGASLLGRDRAPAVLGWAVVAMAVLLVGESVREVAVRRALPPVTPSVNVAAVTRPSDEIIIPVVDRDLWNRFRLLAMRPVYVDHKSHPYLASEVLEWQRRIEAVRQFYLLPDAERPARCREMGAHYFVVPTGGGEDGDNPPFALVPCE